MDLTTFAAEVGGLSDGLVTIAGTSSRGGAVDGVRAVAAPSGIAEVQADEMTVRCGAGTPVVELLAALGEFHQTLAVPASGTVGGALACADSDIRRLGYGPVRDTLLQARYVSADGTLVKAGGPTIKNVSGFDLCRLLVGSVGSLGFLGEVLLRTRPLAAATQWFCTDESPSTVFRRLYRPVSVLWDGSHTWCLIEGHPHDVAEQGRGLTAVEGGPNLAGMRRWSVPVTRCLERSVLPAEAFVVEVGVGVVHTRQAPPTRVLSSGVAELNARLKAEFDPTGRLNPGRMPA